MVKLNAWLLLLAIVLFETSSRTKASIAIPQSADAFVDTIGVNTHLSYPNSCYNNHWETFAKFLIESGIRHIRDSLRDGPQYYYDRHNYLGRNGIKGVFLTDNPSRPADLIRNYPQKVPDIFEAYEGVNEYDLKGLSNWVEITRNWTQFLWENHNSSFPVYAPSLTSLSAYEALGDVSKWVDYVNMHNYYGTYNPVKGWGPQTQYGFTGTIDYFKNLTLLQGGYSKPIITTETGWQTLPAHVIYWVPEIIQARYTLRSLALQYMRGISKTYLYEMCDDGEFFGLLRYNSTDNIDSPSPKPVYRALKGMIQVLSENPKLAIFGLKELSFELRTNETKNANLQKLWLQKSNGNKYLLIWQEVFSYNNGIMSFSPVSVNLNVSMEISRVSKYTFDLDGNMSNESLSFSSNVTFLASDTMSIIEIVPKESSPITPKVSNSILIPQQSKNIQPGKSIRESSSNSLLTFTYLVLLLIFTFVGFQ